MPSTKVLIKRSTRDIVAGIREAGNSVVAGHPQNVTGTSICTTL